MVKSRVKLSNAEINRRNLKYDGYIKKSRKTLLGATETRKIYCYKRKR